MPFGSIKTLCSFSPQNPGDPTSISPQDIHFPLRRVCRIAPQSLPLVLLLSYIPESPPSAPVPSGSHRVPPWPSHLAIQVVEPPLDHGELSPATVIAERAGGVEFGLSPSTDGPVVIYNAEPSYVEEQIPKLHPFVRSPHPSIHYLGRNKRKRRSCPSNPSCPLERQKVLPAWIPARASVGCTGKQKWRQAGIRPQIQGGG